MEKKDNDHKKNDQDNNNIESIEDKKNDNIENEVKVHNNVEPTNDKEIDYPK